MHTDGSEQSIKEMSLFTSSFERGEQKVVLLALEDPFRSGSMVVDVLPLL
jgi:hypothetical protein